MKGDHYSVFPSCFLFNPVEVTTETLQTFTNCQIDQKDTLFWHLCSDWNQWGLSLSPFNFFKKLWFSSKSLFLIIQYFFWKKAREFFKNDSLKWWSTFALFEFQVECRLTLLQSCCFRHFQAEFLVGAFLKKRARLLQSLVFFSFFYLRQTRSDER